jgi:hypothetical protein
LSIIVGTFENDSRVTLFIILVNIPETEGFLEFLMTNTNTAAAEKSAANDQCTSLPSKDQTRRNQDLAKESNDARAGLPEGRTMKLDDSKKRKAGVSLAGGTAHNLNASRIKDGDKVAAATASSTSSIMGLIPRRKELSEEKKTKLLEKARARGLSTEGWNVFWDTKVGIWLSFIIDQGVLLTTYYFW